MTYNKNRTLNLNFTKNTKFVKEDFEPKVCYLREATVSPKYSK